MADPRPTTGTGRRNRGLSLDRIVTATLDLIDAQGVGAASMRTVASELGVKSMSLYKYVDSRDHLLDAVVDRIVDELSYDDGVTLQPVDGWRPWLAGLAHGVRRYARNHPHAFPLVATRPADAPWVNPPLRSLRWIEAFLRGLQREGFTDEQVLFAYRCFNSFLLGFLLLETSEMALRDPRPGDGAFSVGTANGSSEPVDPADPVPGALTPTRSAKQREVIADAQDEDIVDPFDVLDRRRYPTVRRLSAGLAEDRFEQEFAAALNSMLDRIGLALQATGNDGPRPS
jgi:TetR/AcrR family tetracycline transcriptional repressor